MKYDALSDIVKFNEAAGNEIEARPMDDDLVKLYLDLIDEELNGKNELLDSYRKGSLDGTLDGAGDLIVVTAGLILALGSHPNEILYKIIKSNLSKYCETEEDANESVKKYETDDRYINVHWRKVGDLYVILGNKVENPDGAYKILKGINYFEPESLSG